MNEPQPNQLEGGSTGLSTTPGYKSVARPAVPPAAPRVTVVNTPAPGLTPAYVWRVLGGYWQWVVPTGMILSGIAAAIVLLVYVPKYEAKAIIKIEAQPAFIAFAPGQAPTNDDRYVQTQVELLRSPIVLAPALSSPALAALPEIKEQTDPLDFLGRKLSVSQIGKSELFEVAFAGRSPQDAATLVNEVVAKYLEQKHQEETVREQVVIAALEQGSTERKVRVEHLREEVVKLARELTGKDPFEPGVVTDLSALSSAGSLYQNLIEAEVSLEMLKAELQSLKNAPRDAGDLASASGVVDLEIANRPDVRRLEERQSMLREEMLTVKSKPRTKIGEDWSTDPQFLRLQQEAAQVDAELIKLKAAARDELLAARRAAGEADQQRLIAEKEQALSALVVKKSLLAARIQEQVNERKAGGAKSADLEFKKAELEREQNIFELIAARKLALQTEQKAPERVFLMKTAQPPAVAIEPVPYKYLLIACLGALLAPLGAVVGYERMVKRIATPNELRHESTLQVIGEVARFPRARATASRHALPAQTSRDMSVFAESIDSLRTQLMLTEGLGVPGLKKTVAICSAASGEGKSSLASSLTMSLAEATKQPTLIIDADLRDPDVATKLGTPAYPGLAELLKGKASLRQVVYRIGETDAYVLPAGKLRGSPHHLFEGFKVENVLAALRERFATIVIDTPPVLAASESLLFAKAADITVMCSLADVSRAKQVRVAVDRLQTTGANLAGAVLSGVPMAQYVYDYGAYGRDA